MSVGNNVNNFKNNIVGATRKPALRKLSRCCELTAYAYDAAGRMIREGAKRYTYGYLDKVMSVSEDDKQYAYTYHADGQLASANYGGNATETFLWDGLALIQRGGEQYINEPLVGGGNPVASSKGTSYFNDALGTTVGSKKDGKYSAAALTAFGESLETLQGEATSNFKHQTSNSQTFFTGKPEVPGLGHAFLMRNYRAGLAKWQTTDPVGYPDGWNAMAYCRNNVVDSFDFAGASTVTLYMDVAWHVAYGGDGSVGYPVLDVFDFMKNKWAEGTAVMEAIGIKSAEELIKAADKKLDGKVESEIKQLFDSGLWFEELLKQLPVGYERAEPSDSDIDDAIVKKIGANVDYEVVSMTLYKIVPDISVFGGVKFVEGCDLKWKVTVKYE